MEWSSRLPIDLIKCVLVVSHLVKDGIRLCIEQLMNLLAAPAGRKNIIYHTSFWNMFGNRYHSEGRTHFCFLSFFFRWANNLQTLKQKTQKKY